MSNVIDRAEAYLRGHRRGRGLWFAGTFAAAAVVFTTTYALILPAITVEVEDASGDPAISLEQAALDAEALDAAASLDQRFAAEDGEPGETALAEVSAAELDPAVEVDGLPLGDGFSGLEREQAEQADPADQAVAGSGAAPDVAPDEAAPGEPDVAPDGGSAKAVDEPGREQADVQEVPDGPEPVRQALAGETLSQGDVDPSAERVPVVAAGDEDVSPADQNPSATVDAEATVEGAQAEGPAFEETASEQPAAETPVDTDPDPPAQGAAPVEPAPSAPATVAARGADYLVETTYGAEAGLPEGAALTVQEAFADPYENAAYSRMVYDELARLGRDREQVASVRFFDIRFAAGGYSYGPQVPLAYILTFDCHIELADGQRIEVVRLTERGVDVLSQTAGDAAVLWDGMGAVGGVSFKLEGLQYMGIAIVGPTDQARATDQADEPVEGSPVDAEEAAQAQQADDGAGAADGTEGPGDAVAPGDLRADEGRGDSFDGEGLGKTGAHGGQGGLDAEGETEGADGTGDAEGSGDAEGQGAYDARAEGAARGGEGLPDGAGLPDGGARTDADDEAGLGDADNASGLEGPGDDGLAGDPQDGKAPDGPGAIAPATDPGRQVPDAYIVAESVVSADDEPDEDAAADEDGTSKEPTTLTFSGADYSVEATFGPEAAMPEGARLVVDEILPGTDDYDAYCAEALAATQPDGERGVVSFARFFDVRFMSDGAEVEPAAPVAVKISYGSSIVMNSAESLDVVHFADEGTEVVADVNAVSEGGEGVDAVEFVSESFSVMGTVVVVSTVDGLAFDGQGYGVELSMGAEAAVPVGTELVVREIEPGTDEYGAYYSAAAQALEEHGQSVAEARFFDIEFMFEGQGIEPSAPVDVRIQYEEGMAPGDDGQASVVHFSDEGLEVIDNVVVSTADDGTAALFEFTQGSFSVTGTVTTATSNLSNGEYMLVAYDTANNGWYALSNDGTAVPVEYEGSHVTARQGGENLIWDRKNYGYWVAKTDGSRYLTLASDGSGSRNLFGNGSSQDYNNQPDCVTSNSGGVLFANQGKGTYLACENGAFIVKKALNNNLSGVSGNFAFVPNPVVSKGSTVTYDLGDAQLDSNDLLSWQGGSLGVTGLTGNSELVEGESYTLRAPTQAARNAVDASGEERRFTFVGWRVGSSNTILGAGESVALTADAAYTAVWRQDSPYKATYAPDGDQGVEWDEALQAGVAGLDGATSEKFDVPEGEFAADYTVRGATLANRLSADGHTYIFEGWKRSDTGVTYKEGDTIKGVPGDIELVAQWKKVPRVEYRVDGSASAGIVWDETASVEGLDPVGGSGTYREDYGMNDDGTYDLPSVRQIVTPQSDPIARRSADGHDYLFKGWAELGSSRVFAPGDRITNETGDTTLVAVWERTPLITYAPDGDGSVTWKDDDARPVGLDEGVLSEDALSSPYRVRYVTPEQREGADGRMYRFAGWKRSDTGTLVQGGSDIVIANSVDVTLTAQWERIPVVTYVPQGKDIPWRDGQEMPQVEGLDGETFETAYADPYPARGLTGTQLFSDESDGERDYEFAGWQVGDTAQIMKPGETFEPTDDVTLTAVWRTAAMVTYDVDGDAGIAWTDGDQVGVEGLDGTIDARATSPYTPRELTVKKRTDASGKSWRLTAWKVLDRDGNLVKTVLPNEPFEFEEDVTLVAVWDSVPTIAYNPNPDDQFEWIGGIGDADRRLQSWRDELGVEGIDAPAGTAIADEVLDNPYVVKAPESLTRVAKTTTGYSLFTYTFKGWQRADGSVVQPGDELTDLHDGETLKALWSGHYDGFTDDWHTNSVSFYLAIADSIGHFNFGHASSYTDALFTTQVIGGEDWIAHIGGSHGAEGKSNEDPFFGYSNGDNSEWVNEVLRAHATEGITDNTGNYTARLAEFPNDAYILGQVRDWLIRKHKTIDVGDYHYTASEINARDFGVVWYIFKNQSNNGWHVDGYIYRKAARLTVMKTFAGDPSAIEAVKARGDYTVTLQGGGQTYALNLRPYDAATNPYGYRTESNPEGNVYYWTVDGLLPHTPYTLTETGFAADDYSHLGNFRILNSDDPAHNTMGVGTSVTVPEAYSYYDETPYLEYQTVGFRDLYAKTGVMTILKEDATTRQGMHAVDFNFVLTVHDENGNQVVDHVSSLTTDQNGRIVVDFAQEPFNLGPGHYTFTLEELKHDGYKQISVISGQIEVAMEGTVNTVRIHDVSTANADDQGLVEIEKLDDNNYSVLHVRNESEPTNVTVKKVWKNIAEPLPPVTMQLLCNGVAVSGKSVQLDDGNNWTYTWTDLPVFMNGQPAVYTVREDWIGTPGAADSWHYTPQDDTDGYAEFAVTVSKSVDAQTGDSEVTVRNSKDLGQVEFTKVDTGGHALAGAEFTVYVDEACKTVATHTEGKETREAVYTSDDDGYVSVSGLEAGTYFMRETKAPDGYAPSDDLFRLIVSAKGSKAVRYSDGAEVTQVVDEPLTATPAFKKMAEGAADSADGLAGAGLALYGPDYKNPDGSVNAGAVPIETWTSDTGVHVLGQALTVDPKAAAGTAYYLVETSAPVGYYTLKEPVKLLLNLDGTFVVDGSSSSMAKLAKSADGSGSTEGPVGQGGSGAAKAQTVEIIVYNNAGHVLPNTGGCGTSLHTFGGLALVAAGLVGSCWTRRAREGRRTM